MSRVRIAVDDLERGDVPALSIKTGRPCAAPTGVTLRVRGPGRVLAVRRVHAVVAIEPARARMRAAVVRLSAVCALVVPAAILVALFVSAPAGLLLAVVAAAGYLTLVAVGELLWFGAREADQPAFVVLTRVHPEFARAVSR